jgi:hypothetical protein
VLPKRSKIIAASSIFERAHSSDFRDSTFDSLIIQPGLVRSITTAPFASKAGLRLARLLAPARMMVRDLGSFAPSLFAAVSLARMPSGLAVMEKPLRSETVRERRSS